MADTGNPVQRTVKDPVGIFLAVLAVLLFASALLFSHMEKWANNAQKEGMKRSRIEQDLREAPCRSLVLMKDGKRYLICRVADDRPFDFDMLASPAGEWKRVEFDENMRQQVTNVLRPDTNPPGFANNAAEFLKQ